MSWIDLEGRVIAVTPAAVPTDMSATMSRQQIDYLLAKVPMRRFALAGGSGLVTRRPCSICRADGLRFEVF